METKERPKQMMPMQLAKKIISTKPIFKKQYKAFFINNFTLLPEDLGNDTQ